MNMKSAALQKILGSLKGAGAMAGDIGGQIGREGGNVLKGLGSASKGGMGELGALLGKNKLGAGALGAGAAGAAGAGAYGIGELLEELGLADDEDEEMGEDPRHAARARAMRAGMR